MKTSLTSIPRLLACVLFSGLAALNAASAQQIRLDLDVDQVERLIEIISPNDSRPSRFHPEVIQPDFVRPVNPIVVPDVEPVPVPAVVIPQRLQGTWVETQPGRKLYHQLKADGTHHLGIDRNGAKERFAQRASFANGSLTLAGGTYQLTFSQNKTLQLTNGREVRTWVRYEDQQPAVDTLAKQLLGVWYEETMDGTTPMLRRYEFKADGTYNKQAFDPGADGQWDMTNAIDDLAMVVSASERQYRLNGSTLQLAEGHPHREGPLALKLEGSQLLVTNNGVVRTWKRTP